MFEQFLPNVREVLRTLVTLDIDERCRPRHALVGFRLAPDRRDRLILDVCLLGHAHDRSPFCRLDEPSRSHDHRNFVETSGRYRRTGHRHRMRAVMLEADRILDIQACVETSAR